MPKYKPCAAFWLLVIVDWMDPAQQQEIRLDGVCLYSEIFERVMIYKPQFEQVVDVMTTKHRIS